VLDILITALDMGLLASTTLKTARSKNEKVLSKTEAGEMLTRLDLMRESHQLSAAEYKRARQNLEIATADSGRTASAANAGRSKPAQGAKVTNPAKKNMVGQRAENKAAKHCQTATCKQIKGELDRLHASGLLTSRDREEALQKLYGTLNPGAATPKPAKHGTDFEEEELTQNATAAAVQQTEMIEIMAGSAASVSVKPANKDAVRKRKTEPEAELDPVQVQIEKMKLQAKKAGSIADVWLEAMKASSDGPENLEEVRRSADRHPNKPAPKQHARRMSPAEALREMRADA
jgi:hypothetical protein